MINLQTKFPLAITSNDFLEPWGTRLDSSTNKRFNKKLYKLFPQNKPIKVLDLGCSGGGFIQSIIEDGHIGVGVEGSDWSKNLGRGAWNKITTLFTADITKPLTVYEGSEMMKFDVITAWDVLEHIKEEDLFAVVNSILNHLKPKGLFICSIDEEENAVNGIHLHQTIQPKWWWENRLLDIGKSNKELVKYFNNQFLRGGKYDKSFNLVLTSGNYEIPKLTYKEKLMDMWWGSRAHRRIKNLLRNKSKE